MNTFGRLFRVTTWGESHGSAIGCVVDGCPCGLELKQEEIQAELDRRRPGQSSIVTPRAEEDRVEILSGLFEGKSLGTPISMLIQNRDVDSSKYEAIKDTPRPGHGDLTWREKFGHVDWRGGGRSSARETAARVAASGVVAPVSQRDSVFVGTPSARAIRAWLRLRDSLSSTRLRGSNTNPLRVTGHTTSASSHPVHASSTDL